MKRALALVVAVCCVLVTSRAASAGEFDLTGDLWSFTSPGDVYGPWQSLTASYRWRSGNDTPGIAFVTRADRDRPTPTHSDGVTIDDYHDWSPKFFTYAAASFAGGDVLPTRSFYVEGDRKFGATLATVMGLGVGVVVNPNGVDQRYVNVGPSFYWSNVNLTLRYLQTFTSGRTGTGTGIATVGIGHTGATLANVTLLAGDQPPNGLVSTTPGVFLGQRALFGSINVKHWTDRNGGVIAGVSFERLTDRLSGDPIYFSRSLEVGIFRNIGPALP